MRSSFFGPMVHLLSYSIRATTRGIRLKYTDMGNYINLNDDVTMTSTIFYNNVAYLGFSLDYPNKSA